MFGLPILLILPVISGKDNPVDNSVDNPLVRVREREREPTMRTASSPGWL